MAELGVEALARAPPAGRSPGLAGLMAAALASAAAIRLCAGVATNLGLVADRTGRGPPRGAARQRVGDARRAERPTNPDAQAFARDLIGRAEPVDRAPGVRAHINEVFMDVAAATGGETRKGSRIYPP